MNLNYIRDYFIKLTKIDTLYAFDLFSKYKFIYNQLAFLNIIKLIAIVHILVTRVLNLNF